jgi:RNA polymerase sigma-70 factor (ECF subfamily)
MQQDATIFASLSSWYRRMRMNELDLIKACIAKDPRAQRMLYDQYAGKMLAVCQRYCASTEEAEDAFQEGFVKVFAKIKDYKHDGAFGGWIRRIMVNTVLDHLRKNKKHLFHENVDEVFDVSTQNESPLEALSAQELFKVLEQIPDGYRVVFNLFAIEGYSHKEIAEQLNITESTSKSQFLRARKYIKKCLEEINFSSERV